MTLSRINRRCRYFAGSKPCVFNKADGSECPDCRHLSAFGQRILFIKLDAIGDVLRSASLMPLLRQRHADAYVAWLTRRESVELVRMVAGVDEVITLDEVAAARLVTGGWDHVYSLSNDATSAALASMASPQQQPIGFFMQQGILTPSNDAAARWLEMAAFDRVKRQNSQSYQELMCDIIGAAGPAPPPALIVPVALRDAAAARIDGLFHNSGRRRVAINLGSGARWPKKMLDAQQIVACCRQLRQHDLDVMLLGGVAEAGKARAVLDGCGGDRQIQAVLTEASIPEFVAVMMQADAMLCGDTLAMHIATAIGLPSVVVFGPTSQAEIADFDGLLDKTWVDSLDCLSCYGDCDKPQNCMSLLDIPSLVAQVIAQLRSATAGAGT